MGLLEVIAKVLYKGRSTAKLEGGAAFQKDFGDRGMVEGGRTGA